MTAPCGCCKVTSHLRCKKIVKPSSPRTVATAKRRNAGHLLVLWLMMLAFLAQSYVTQTHIHTSQDIFQQAAAKTDVAAAQVTRGQHDNQPANDDPANCPFCQELIHSGAYIAPAAIPLFLTSILVLRIEPVLKLQAHYDSVSHNWRGRGPPHI
jgi:hypothetical protein